MSITLDGYHGTNASNAQSILEKGICPSFGDDEWLGDGAYFFVEGLSNRPDEQAEQWAKAQAWDNLAKCLKYRECAIIKARIEVEEQNLLDLTNSDGIEVLNYLIDRFVEKIRESGKRLKMVDGCVINLARSEKILNIEVAKGNFYIKFANERRLQINRRTPNCTICAVFDPSNNLVDFTSHSVKDI